MTDHTPHPHAELIQQWCDDHKVIPPMHEWEFQDPYLNSESGSWVLMLRGYGPVLPRCAYRRVIKPTPHPNAEQIMQWAQDNQTVPPAHEWEYRHDGSEAWHRLSVGSSPTSGSNVTFRRVQK